MITGKNNLVVGLTTINNEMLRISVPALARLRQKFLLIIFNDNPATVVSRRMIHAMGYRGDLLIINSESNVGTLAGRMGIINAVASLKNRPEWMVFCDDDDIIVNLDVPVTSDDNFAIIQNSMIIRHRLVDVLRAMNDINDIIVDGDNVIIQKPHMDFVGTLFRTDVLIGMTNTVAPYMDKINDICTTLSYRAPINRVMWSWTNMYAKFVNPNAVPIYMDRVNYIAIKIDSGTMKYGHTIAPIRNANEQYARVLARYDAIMNTALDDNAAAPAGQN